MSRHVTGGHTYSQRTSLKCHVLERDNRTCQLCGAPSEVVDHIVPWAISRDSTLANLRALCRKCNLATRREAYDSSLPLADWYQAIEDCLTGRPNNLFMEAL